MRRRWFLVGAAALLAGGLAYWFWPRPDPDPSPAPSPRIVWVFEAPRPGGFVAPPTVTDGAIYASALHVHGFRRSGAVYALDPATGKPLWTFDDDMRMGPTASAPVPHDGRLYFGEGMHADFVCQFYCLDAATGSKRWSFETNGHIESTPAIASGTVFLTAGDDGVHALDAATGKPRWHFAADVHIDASPHVAGGKLFLGSGPSRRFKSLQVLCLNTASGEPVWRVPTPLPAWGSPTVHGGRVFVGLGNGRLTEGARPPETPAGALLCLDPADGRTLWSFPTPDAVFQKPTIHGDRVLFGSRDGHVYCLNVADGKERWRTPMGGPVIAPPTADGGRLLAVSTGGLLKCLSVSDGREVWSFDLERRLHADVLVLAQVRVSGGRLYLAAEVTTGAGAKAALFCLEP